MFSVVLFEPEIPPNTGNVIRLCANTGAALHLIHPLGFRMDDRGLRRAGLDYHEYASVREHSSFESYVLEERPVRLFALSTRGSRYYSEVSFRAGDAFLFGSETRGLPQRIWDALQPRQCLRIPMQEGSRSLNLSNAVALVVFEAWRQQEFEGALNL